MSGGNYVPLVVALASELEPGGFVVTVKHDDWCAIWSGRPCDCSPELVVRPVEAS